MLPLTNHFAPDEVLIALKAIIYEVLSVVYPLSWMDLTHSVGIGKRLERKDEKNSKRIPPNFSWPGIFWIAILSSFYFMAASLFCAEMSHRTFSLKSAQEFCVRWVRRWRGGGDRPWGYIFPLCPERHSANSIEAGWDNVLQWKLAATRQRPGFQTKEEEGV